MSSCDRYQADAAGLASLPSGDPEREAARAHARECADCRRALQAAERLQEGLAASSPRPTIDGGAFTVASEAIVTELRRERRRRMVTSAIAMAAALSLAVGLARNRSPSQTDRGLALALALAALSSAVGSVVRSWAIFIAATVPAASLALVLAIGGGGALRPEVGIDCLATELACAATVLCAAWVALRGGSTSLGPRTAAASAAAGALAGMAALELTCPAHGALWHLVLFHVAGVVLATATAGILWHFAPALFPSRGSHG